MKAFIAFIKKEFTEQIRSSRFLVLFIVFSAIGIMNPAIAKLTPWLLEALSESLEENGMSVTAVTVDAMTSWVQFFKNVPMGLIVFIIMQSGIFTKEYTSGTLVLSLTKGLARYKVTLAKSTVLVLLWTLYYWICFCITYLYNAYFWDNSIAKSLYFSVFCWWLFGILTIALTVLFSSVQNTSTTVLASVGGVCFLAYLISLIPKAEKFMPTLLMDGNSLIYGLRSWEDYLTAVIITAVLSVVSLALSVIVFNKRKI